MAIVDRVTDLVTPVLDALQLGLYDVEYSGGNLRVTVDKPGGVTLDELEAATRALGRALDQDDPLPGAYTLEVSSPGVERRLRTSEHFAVAVGELITVKLGPQVEGDRRVVGVLVDASEDSLTIRTEGGDERSIDRNDITRANTVFVWDTGPEPGSAEARARARAGFAKKTGGGVGAADHDHDRVDASADAAPTERKARAR